MTILPEDRYASSTPGWSPDGGRLVFTAARSGGADTQLYAVNADGTGLTTVRTAP